jgi:hypothetical protein
VSKERLAPALALDPAKVHAWHVERQLLGRLKAADPVEVARTLVGVQAQVTSSAALAIALRSKPRRGGEPGVEATAKALGERRLVRSWAMRGTLHLFAAEDVPLVAAALRGKDNWRRPAWLRWFGVTELEMDRLIDAICEVLDDGRPRTRAELALEITKRQGEQQGKLLLGSWGSALKVASDRHYLVQSAEEGAGVRFVRASRWIDGWRDEDPAAALATLVERYLAAYGPASLRELLRWWGVATVAHMRPIVASLGDALTEVDVGGVQALVRTADIDSIEATTRKKGTVALVGGFDPFIVGAGLREQLFPPLHLKRISRIAGWISPVMLRDGVAAGVWDSRRSAKGLAITIETFDRTTAVDRSAIGRAAERIGAALGLPVTVAFGKVFAEKRSSAPFNDR